MSIDDLAKPLDIPHFNFDLYMSSQTNYIHDLWFEARQKGDCLQYKKVSEFAVNEYFKHGYDQAWRKYYCGLGHKPKWGDLK